MKYASWPSLWSFLQNPHYRDTDKNLSWRKALLLCLLCYVFMQIVNIMQMILFSPVAELMDNQKSTMVEEITALKDTPWLLIFMLVLLAPVSEEFWFRFGLRRYHWKIMTIWAFAMVAVIFFFFLDVSQLNIIMALSVSAFFAVGLYFTKKKEQVSDDFWLRYFPRLFWASAFLFGLAHYQNFLGGTFSLAFLYFMFIYLISRTLLGAILAYIRMRLGFIYAIIAHALNNALPALVILLVPEEILQENMMSVISFTFGFFA